MSLLRRGRAARATDETQDDLRPSAALLERARELRARLRARPELGHEEHRTAQLLEAELSGLDVRRLAGTGLRVLVGPSRGPRVVLRAELDAVPVAGRADGAGRWRPRAAHACGHDVHMAALAACCRLLAAAGARLPVGVVALFQPSEEQAPSGARILTRSPLLRDLPTGAVVGLHLHPGVEWGTVAMGSGPVNAAADELRLTVHGAGASAAYPQAARDPVSGLCQVVLALQAAVARRVDPLRPARVSIGQLAAAGGPDVVPDSASAVGTLRYLYSEDRQQLHGLVREVAVGAAATSGCRATVEFEPRDPSTRNHPQLAAAVRAALVEGGLAAADPIRTLGADEFGHYARLGPLALGFVGLAGHPDFEALPLHDPHFAPPDDAVDLLLRALVGAYRGAAAFVLESAGA